MKSRVEFKVAVNLPEGMTVADMCAYIRDAVSSWGGQYEPNVDPRFGMHRNRVTVVKMAKKRIKKAPEGKNILTGVIA